MPAPPSQIQTSSPPDRTWAADPATFTYSVWFIRISDFEIVSDFDIRISDFISFGFQLLDIRISDFEFVSDFDIRISDLSLVWLVVVNDRLPHDFLDRREPIEDRAQAGLAQGAHALLAAGEPQLVRRGAGRDQVAQLVVHDDQLVQ